jgi:hypothetical protein
MATIHLPAAGTVRDETDQPEVSISIRALLAGLSAAAGAIHLVMVGSHAEASTLDGMQFALAGWLQIGLAFWLFSRPSRLAYALNLGLNLGLIGAWAVSRTVGLPWGAHAGVAEDVGRVDLLCVGIEVVLVLVSAVLLLRPQLAMTARGPLIGVLAAVPLLTVMALTTAALASGEAAEHGGPGHSHDGGAAAGHGHGDEAEGHGHGTGEGETALGALSAADVCDGDANVASYYEALADLGPDHHAAGGDGGHGHGGGSAESQLLVEFAAENGIALPEQVVDDLTSVLGTEPSVVLSSGEHGAGGPFVGLDGHGSPQHWTPLTDPAECAALQDELDQALAVADAHPTVQDALDAGYIKATGYIEGIAAHYIKLSELIDPGFDAAQPEMLLYDGDQPDSRMIGISYATFSNDVIDPAEHGFTGPNDYPHNHDGLCTRGGLVVGSEATSDEECARRGGSKIGAALQMIHAWVVPGCESPYGVFSAENPVLDRALGQHSTQPGSANCAFSDYELDSTPGIPEGLRTTN